MTIYLFLGLLIILGLGAYIHFSSHDRYELCGILITIWASVILVLSLLFLPIKYYSTRAEILQFKETQKTFDRIRQKDPKSLEKAAIQIDIVQMNRRLVELQYWNKTIFDWYISDEVMELKPIE